MPQLRESALQATGKAKELVWQAGPAAEQAKQMTIALVTVRHEMRGQDQVPADEANQLPGAPQAA